MKAIVKTKPEPGLELREVEKPKIEPDQILLEVKAAAICGTDVHIYDWTPGYEFMPLPVIIGHEISGEVVEVGEEVNDYQKGDRVACDPVIYCGKCTQCKAGKINRCYQYRLLGEHQDGGFAKYALIPPKIGGLYKLPENIAYKHAALLQPYCVAYHAFETSEVRLGDSAVVIGPGPIGLMVTQILKLAGIANVAVTGLKIDEHRLEVARRIGADLTVNIEEEDPIEVIKKNTDGEGVDAVFEASGSPDVFLQALNMVRKGGEIIGIGISPRTGNLNFTDIVRREIKLKGVRLYTSSSWKRVLASLKRIEMDPLITHELSLENFMEGFEALKQKKAIKVVLVP